MPLANGPEAGIQRPQFFVALRYEAGTASRTRVGWSDVSLMTERSQPDGPDQGETDKAVAYLLAFLVLPFLQVGFSFYVSGMTVVALIMLVKFREQIAASTLSHPMRTLLCCLSVIMPLMFPFEIDGQDVGRVLREALFILLMVSSFGVVSEKMDSATVRKLTSYIYILIGFYLCLSLVQTAFLSRQVYFGLPRALFVANEGTIPGELDLLYSKIRATGTFGEPSYLGFVLTSLAFALFPLARKWVAPRIAIVVVVLVALICQSLSFFIAIALLLAYERPGFREFKASYVLPGIVVMCVMGIYFSEVIESFLGRVTSLSNSAAEPSGFVRIFGPISILPDFLAEFPTGVPFYKLYPVLEAYVPIGLRPLSFYDNGLINFVLDFGFYGFLLLYLYFASVKDGASRIYLFAAGIFNGALLSPDKLGVMILVFSLYNSFQIYARDHDRRRAPAAAAGATQDQRSRRKPSPAPSLRTRRMPDA